MRLSSKVFKGATGTPFACALATRSFANAWDEGAAGGEPGCLPGAALSRLLSVRAGKFSAWAGERRFFAFVRRVLLIKINPQSTNIVIVAIIPHPMTW